MSDGTLPCASEDLLTTYLERIGADLEAVGLERVLESGSEAAIGEVLSTSSGTSEVAESGGHHLRVPGLERRDGRWVHTGGFAGAGGRSGRHSEDFAPLWEELTGLYRAHPGARW